MHMTFRNVNTAFFGLVSSIHMGRIPVTTRASRVGEILQIEEPMTITYTHPRERVLFNRARDANPFFHLFESLWMLAGRNDVAPLKYYSSKIGDVASDDGETFNGAYGHRWRKVFYWCPERNGLDQLNIIIEHLRKMPDSRRVVLQMWNVEDDLLKIERSKDVCCNTAAYFNITRGPCEHCDRTGKLVKTVGLDDCPKCKGFPSEVPRWLNMTVTNRSNDMIWGMLGANVVHFSFLQEYIACCLGLEVGCYNQFTNNLHVYTENNGGWHPEKWMEEYKDDEGIYYPDTYLTSVGVTPLVKDKTTFDREVQSFVGNMWMQGGQPVSRPPRLYDEPFLENVAKPMCLAFSLHKARDYKLAQRWLEYVADDDWRLAGQNWIAKRKAAYNSKQEAAE